MARATDPIERADIERLLLMLDDEKVQEKIAAIVREKVKISLAPESLKQILEGINLNLDLEALCNQLQVVNELSDGTVQGPTFVGGLRLTIKPKEVPSTSIKTENGG